MSDNPGAPAQGKRPLRFPDGFLIGASTAGHQTEGNNTNSDWWEFEHRPGSSGALRPAPRLLRRSFQNGWNVFRRALRRAHVGGRRWN